MKKDYSLKYEKIANKINKLEKIVNNLNTEINNLKDVIDKNINVGLTNIGEKLKKIIKEQTIELDILKSYRFKNYEQLIIVNFTSSDGNINFPVVCESSNKFDEIEKKFYKEYQPNNGEKYSFFSNGSEIRRFNTMEQNGFFANEISVKK